jgi:hypothetical protein
MSLSIFEFGDGRFRLFRGEEEVGWVDGRDIGFRGFTSSAAAADAATTAYNALSGWLARQSLEQAPPRRVRRLGRRVTDGEQHLTVGGIAVGRLLSGPADRIALGGSHGFELRLPPRIGAALSAAQVVDQALGRHRTPPAAAHDDAIGHATATVGNDIGA